MNEISDIFCIMEKNNLKCVSLYNRNTDDNVGLITHHPLQTMSIILDVNERHLEIREFAYGDNITTIDTEKEFIFRNLFINLISIYISPSIKFKNTFIFENCFIERISCKDGSIIVIKENCIEGDV